MNKKHYSFIRMGLWIGSVLFIFIIGITSFIREYPGTSLMEAFYYTLRLFTLEHDLPRFPRSNLLIFIYFFAPLVSLSVLWTATMYLFRFSPLLKTRWQTDHIIVCGVGRTGKLLAATFKEKGISIVGVDAGKPESFDEWSGQHRIPMIYGDFLSWTVLEKAGASNARAIVFAAGDDLLNLEGVVNAYGWLRTDMGDVKLLWAHISSEKLAQTARTALRTDGLVGIRFFDTYHIAATKMVEQYFNYDIRKDVNEVTIMGFGKFGRDLTEVLIKDCKPDENFSIKVVDIQDREKDIQDLLRYLGISRNIEFVKADVRDLQMSDENDKAFFLCTDDDIGNLATALMLTHDKKGTYIYVRMARWPMPAIEDHLKAKNGIAFVNINDLVIEGVSALPGIFEPAKESDLKRTGRNT